MKTIIFTFFSIIVSGILFTSCNLIKVLDGSKNEKLTFSEGACKFKFIDNQIILETKFSDDLERYFLLDLGSPISVVFIDSSFNDIINDKTTISGISKATSANGSNIKREYLAWGLIKTKWFELENSFQSSIKRPDPLYCNRLSGVWGASLFAPDFKGPENKILLIKMQDTTVAILDTLPALDKWIQIETDFNILSHIIVKTSINGKTTKLIFDTGFSGSIVMTDETYRATQKGASLLSDEKRVYGYITNSLSGTQIDTAYLNKYTINLGKGIITDSVPVISTQTFAVNALGMEYIKRFNVLIDYQNKKLYLQPNPNIKNQKKSFFDCKGFKALNMYNNKITILNLTVNSPAEKAGLKIGDQILSINNIIVNESDNCEVEKLFKELDGNINNNEIVVKRGNETLKFTL